MRKHAHRPWTTLAPLLLALAGCPQEDEKSNLERMSSDRSDAGAEKAETKSEEKTPPKKDPEASDAGAEGVTSTGEGEKVQLRLALADGASYQITTVGLVTFPAVQQPVGFARRELISLSDCDSEGPTRKCTLNHEYKNYEAELPTGAPLENGEKPVMDLKTSHQIDGTGKRHGTTKVEGEAEKLEHADAKALADAHRFYCMRLPDEPVGVGATWKDTCRMRTGGQIVTKEAEWTLKKLDDDPEGAGKRAELMVKSAYKSVDAVGNARTGVARGVLYLWVDAGEPHLYREMIVQPVGDKGLKTKTSINYQFAKVDPKDPEKVVRTDGAEFPGFRTLNDFKAEQQAEGAKGDKQPARAPEGDAPG